MVSRSGLRGPSFLSGLEGTGSVEVRSGQGQDEVWVTFEGCSAVRYDLSEMCVRCVLSVPSHVRLSTPVCHDLESGLDLCVINHNTLLAFKAVNEQASMDSLIKDNQGHQLSSGLKAVDMLRGAEEDKEGDLYVLFDDGQLQTVKCLMKAAAAENAEVKAAAKAANQIYCKVNERTQKIERKETSVFSWKGRPHAAHIFRVVHPKTMAALGPVTVRICRIGVDPETLACKQTTVNTIELPAKSVKVATRVGHKVVYVQDGRVYTKHMFDEDDEGESYASDVIKNNKNSASDVTANKIGLATQKVALEKAEFVARLSADKVVVLGAKSGGSEGHAVMVVDVGAGSGPGGFAVDAVNVKAVVQTSGKMLSCHGGNRVFFKHGHRMATIFAENLPRSLADFVGKGAFSAKTVENSAEKGNKAASLDFGTWEDLELVSQPLVLYQSLPEILSKDGKMEDIARILDNFSDIPELLVLNLIEMLLSLPADSDSSAGNSPQQQQREDLLSRTFNVSVSEPILLQHLRVSDFKFVRDMLRHLLAMVQIETTANRPPQGGGGDGGFYFEQHLTWIGCILNAHYGNFLLSQDESVKALLDEALETVEILESSLCLMGETMTVLRLIQDKQMIQPDYSNKSYTIEIVDF